ncbi:MAG: ORF6N domain-containing protein [Sphingobacteriia bacterium]|nr:ORF6N domain-containing protein [Sphingobacteriia bacterium]
MNNSEVIAVQKYRQNILNLIFTIRGKQVMIDENLADLYGIETKYLNRAVKRNPDRFPESFMFQLTKEEYEGLRSQNGTLDPNDALRFQSGTLKTGRGQHRKYLPYAFTEQGVAMLSGVLNTETAVRTSIYIMDAFVQMRHFLIENADLIKRIETVELKQVETDNKVHLLLETMEKKELKPRQGIFFNGQVFDAWKFMSDLVKNAKNSLILIDNYVDESVLSLFAKKKKTVTVDVYTKTISRALQQDANKFNTQYGGLTLHPFDISHDRFLLIDKTEVFHIGASLKDLGKKWFAFSMMDKDSLLIMDKLGV